MHMHDIQVWLLLLLEEATALDSSRCRHCWLSSAVILYMIQLEICEWLKDVHCSLSLSLALTLSHSLTHIHKQSKWRKKPPRWGPLPSGSCWKANVPLQVSRNAVSQVKCLMFSLSSFLFLFFPIPLSHRIVSCQKWNVSASRRKQRCWKASSIPTLSASMTFGSHPSKGRSVLFWWPSSWRQEHWKRECSLMKVKTFH